MRVFHLQGLLARLLLVVSLVPGKCLSEGFQMFADHLI